ncbi:MAG: hypothetical protein ACRDKE_01575, partial [Solirubrobacterales bacterium]
MSTFVGEIQREIEAIANAKGACLGTKYLECGLLLELTRDLHEEDPTANHSDDPRIAVSDLITTAILRRFKGEKTDQEIRAKEVFFLTETHRAHFENVEQISFANQDERDLLSQLLATHEGDELAEIVRKLREKEAMPTPLHEQISEERNVGKKRPRGRRPKKTDETPWRWV